MSTLDYKIQVMKAANEGKPIQYRLIGSTNWIGVNEHYWDWRKCDYRVKPQEVELVVYRYKEKMYACESDVFEDRRHLNPQEIQRITVEV